MAAVAQRRITFAIGSDTVFADGLNVEACRVIRSIDDDVEHLCFEVPALEIVGARFADEAAADRAVGMVVTITTDDCEYAGFRIESVTRRDPDGRAVWDLATEGTRYFPPRDRPEPALLDPRENRDYLVWWNAVAESSGQATALVFADWLEERGLTAVAEKIRTSDNPALDARRLVDLSRCRRDGQGRMVLGFATVRQLAEGEPR
jgi:uncharacterized protein (TIGR02996 family)